MGWTPVLHLSPVLRSQGYSISKNCRAYCMVSVKQYSALPDAPGTSVTVSSILCPPTESHPLKDSGKHQPPGIQGTAWFLSSWQVSQSGTGGSQRSFRPGHQRMGGCQSPLSSPEAHWTKSKFSRGVSTSQEARPAVSQCSNRKWVSHDLLAHLQP